MEISLRQRVCLLSLFLATLVGCGTETSVIIYESDSSSDSISVRMMFNAGSAYDPPGKEGLARLVAMSFWVALDPSTEESDAHPSYFDITIDREVVTIDGRFSHDEWVPFSLVYTSILSGPQFNEPVASALIELQSSHLDTLRTFDDMLCREVLQARIFKNHPYGHPPEGIDSSLSAITAEDMTEFFRTHYTNSNPVFGIAGNISLQNAIDFRKQILLLPSTEPITTLPQLPIPSIEGINAFVIEKPDLDYGTLLIGTRADIMRGDSDFAAWYLACNYLGRHGGRLAELLDIERDLSFAAWSYSEHVEPYADTELLTTGLPRRAQYFSIEAQPNLINQQFVMRIILAEMETIKNSGIPSGGLEKTRAYLIEKITAEREHAVNRMHQRLDDLWLGIEGFSEGLVDALQTTTHQQVNAVARRVLDPANLHIVAICEDGQKLASTLLSGQVNSQYPRGINRSLLRVADNKIFSYQPQWNPNRIRIIKAEELFR
jgi:zinc protease